MSHEGGDIFRIVTDVGTVGAKRVSLDEEKFPGMKSMAVTKEESEIE